MHPIHPLLMDIARSRMQERQAVATRWRKRVAMRRERPTQSQSRSRFQSVLSLLLML